MKYVMYQNKTVNYSWLLSKSQVLTMKTQLGESIDYLNEQFFNV